MTAVHRDSTFPRGGFNFHGDIIFTRGAAASILVPYLGHGARLHVAAADKFSDDSKMDEGPGLGRPPRQFKAAEDGQFKFFAGHGFAPLPRVQLLSFREEGEKRRERGHDCGQHNCFALIQWTLRYTDASLFGCSAIRRMYVLPQCFTIQKLLLLERYTI